MLGLTWVVDHGLTFSKKTYCVLKWLFVKQIPVKRRFFGKWSYLKKLIYGYTYLKFRILVDFCLD